MTTQKISTAKIKPGMTVAEDVYTSGDQMVLNKGTVLTDRSITRLKFYSVREIYIELDEPTDAEADEKPAPKRKSETSDNMQDESISYTERVKKSEDYKKFAQNYKQTLDIYSSSLSNFAKNKGGLNTAELLDQVKHMYNSVETSGKLLDMLMCIRSLDDLTFVHGINVALICNVFGQWLKISKEDLEILTLAGLLHDVGKLTIPDKILKKKGALTAAEYETIKSHTTAGYALLKDLPIDKRISKAALQHHERCDGSGYPEKRTADEIDDFAKIVAIADVYDAMTAARCYRGPICPLEVLNEFEKDGLTKYDTKYLMTFMDHVVSTYQHQYVLLSNGNIGEIVMVNKHTPARPIIKLLNSKCVDLSKERDLTIVGIV